MVKSGSILKNGVCVVGHSLGAVVVEHVGQVIGEVVVVGHVTVGHVIGGVVLAT